MNKDKEIPTAWAFVWSDGRYFSSLSEETIKSYANGAFSSFGASCGKICPIYDIDPHIVEGSS